MIVPSLNIHHQDSDARLWKWQARWWNARLRHHSLSCRAPVRRAKNGLPCALSQSSLRWPESRGQNKRCHKTKVVVLLSSCSALQIWTSSLLATEMKLIVEGGYSRWWVSTITFTFFFFFNIRENVLTIFVEQSQERKGPSGICSIRGLVFWRTPERSIHK